VRGSHATAAAAAADTDWARGTTSLVCGPDWAYEDLDCVDVQGSYATAAAAADTDWARSTTSLVCGPDKAHEDLDCVDVQGSYTTAAAAAADPDWGEEAAGGWGYEDEGPAQAKQFRVGCLPRLVPS
jgi:hypothetical protein